MPSDAFLALGSNLGDRKALVDAAVKLLAALPDTSLTARSSYYRTEPVGPVPQDWFLNLVVWLRTDLQPEAVLDAAHLIEAELGRDRSREVRWGPRTLDIDLIAHGDASRSGPGLLLPHPRFAERAFVLVPLAEIAPHAVIAGRSVAEHLGAVGSEGVERLEWSVPPAARGSVALAAQN